MLPFKFKKLIRKFHKNNWRKDRVVFKMIDSFVSYEGLCVEYSEFIGLNWYRHNFYGPSRIEYTYKNKVTYNIHYLLNAQFSELDWMNARKLIKGFSTTIDKKINGKKYK